MIRPAHDTNRNEARSARRRRHGAAGGLCAARGLLGAWLACSAVAAALALAPSPCAAQTAAEWLARGQTAATPEEAREAFSRALELEPNRIEALMGRAGASSDDPARLRHADDDFSRVIALAPTHWEAYLRRGALRYRIGRDARWNSQMNTGARWLRLAMDDLTRFLEAQPDGPSAPRGPGAAHALEVRARAHTILDEYADALRDYAAGAVADPERAPALHLERARILTIQGKKDEGLAVYDSVAQALRDLSREDTSASGHRAGPAWIAQRGEALWQLGRKEEACADYRWLCADAAGADPAHLDCRRARERCP